MAIEKVKELIKAIQTDPKAKELLKGASEPKSEEDMIRLCAEVAPKLGFDVTEADIRETVAAAVQARKEKTVQKLSDEDVAQASGGAFWTNDDAPDGHEYGCFLTYHSDKWQIEHGYSCPKEYLCSSGIATTNDNDLVQQYAICADQYFHLECKLDYYKK